MNKLSDEEINELVEQNKSMRDALNEIADLNFALWKQKRSGNQGIVARDIARKLMKKINRSLPKEYEICESCGIDDLKENMYSDGIGNFYCADCYEEEKED